MRKPMYAGSFYPRNEQALIKAIETCFGGEFGPGELPKRSAHSAKGHSLKAVISPHAGYQYSGMAAAWSYRALAESGLPDVFVILAPSHRLPRSGISLETFETPLGLVRVDQEFAKAIAEKGTIPIDDEVHIPEHSLEVQLPFLQYVFHGSEERIKIVPILVSQDIDLNQAAIDIKEAIMDTGRKVCFIVSSDFTHYGADFGYIPFRGEGKELKNQIAKLDSRAISIIQKGDAEGFATFLKETDATICGAYPILLLLKTLKFKEAELKKYYVSGDLTGDYSGSVSYVSMVFR